MSSASSYSNRDVMLDSDGDFRRDLGQTKPPI